MIKNKKQKHLHMTQTAVLLTAISLIFFSFPQRMMAQDKETAEELPQPVILSGEKGENGWYTTAVTVTPSDGLFEISKTEDPDAFADSVVFDEDDPPDKKIWLRNRETKELSGPVLLDLISVDRQAPDSSRIGITYSEPLWSTVLDAVTFGYYQSEVHITFTAFDEGSGIRYFTWNLTGASEPAEEDRILYASPEEENEGYYSAVLTLPKEKAEQIRGSLCVSAVDFAGWKSDTRTDSGNILVVDSISPSLLVSYQQINGGNGNIRQDTRYFSDDVEMTFELTEQNFYPQDLQIRLSKDEGEPEALHVTDWEPAERADTYTGHYRLSGDGEYVVSASLSDRSQNRMEEYTSDRIVIDTVPPVISVTYANKDAVSDTSRCYSGTQEATILIDEKNFDPSQVSVSILGQDFSGNLLKGEDMYLKSPWATTQDSHAMSVTFFADASYLFEVSCRDLAGNTPSVSFRDSFSLDNTPPEILSVSYSESVLDTVLEGLSFGFYRGKMSVTVQVRDPGSRVASVSCEQLAMQDDGTPEPAVILPSGPLIFTGDGCAEASFELTAEQWSGQLKFTAADCCGNFSERTEDRQIILDTTAPEGFVEWNPPFEQEDQISYYREEAAAEITIREKHFFPEDVSVTLTKDGDPVPVQTDWKRTGILLHKGRICLKDDGEYTLRVSYRDKSENQMKTYTSGKIIVDSAISTPVITVNREPAGQRAFPGYAVIEAQFEDRHFKEYSVSLVKTGPGGEKEELSGRLARSSDITETGGSVRFANIDWLRGNDGIYTMTVNVCDKSGNETSASSVFSVNRFGSVYTYSSYLKSLIRNGGQYVKKIEDDLIITEYNADRLTGNSPEIQISRDGRPLSDIRYTVSPRINNQVLPGDKGWFQYQYTLDKRNFSRDGLYKITLASADEAGNRAETSLSENDRLVFTVDSTPPEIESITGLEEEIVDRTKIPVSYVIYDAQGLEEISVYLDDEKIESVTDFSKDRNRYEGSFEIRENNAPRTVRITARDLAGNETDTQKESFHSAYEFHDKIVVTTNDLVRSAAADTVPVGTFLGILFCSFAGMAILLLWRRRT